MCCQRRAARVQCATTSATQSVTIQVDGHHDLMVARARAARAARKLDQFAARKVDHLKVVDSMLSDAAGVRPFGS